jgi:hypothetical protein
MAASLVDHFSTHEGADADTGFILFGTKKCFPGFTDYNTEIFGIFNYIS